MISIDTQARAALTPGRVVAERYRLVRPLLGMAPSNTWLAEHREQGKRIALEFLPPSVSEDAELLEGFMNEARSAARVVGEGVARVVDFGVEVGGHPYVALDLPDGESLESRLLTRHRLGAPELARIVQDTAEALELAHAIGMIHGSLKPANLFITSSGPEATKLLFSVARIMTDTLELVRRMTGRATRTAAPAGSVAYMSPEQILGDEGLDHRTDLWSLAVIAFECLTGALPFLERLRAIASSRSAPNLRCSHRFSLLSPGFEGWFLRGVHKSKEPAVYVGARDGRVAEHDRGVRRPRDKDKCSWAGAPTRQRQMLVGWGSHETKTNARGLGLPRDKDKCSWAGAPTRQRTNARGLGLPRDSGLSRN